MVTSLNNSMPARDFGYGGGSQAISGRITATGAAAVNVKIGVLPAGAVILAVSTDVETAFTGGTPVFNVGTTSGGAQILAAIALTAGSLNSVPLATLTMPFAADTEVWVGLSGTPTAGDAYVVVTYIKPVG